jgi:hypothetical protein
VKTREKGTNILKEISEKREEEEEKVFTKKKSEEVSD